MVPLERVKERQGKISSIPQRSAFFFLWKYGVCFCLITTTCFCGPLLRMAVRVFSYFGYVLSWYNMYTILIFETQEKGRCMPRSVKFKGMYTQNSTARSRIHACAGGSNKDQLNTTSIEDPPVMATSA